MQTIQHTGNYKFTRSWDSELYRISRLDLEEVAEEMYNLYQKFAIANEWGQTLYFFVQNLDLAVRLLELEKKENIVLWRRDEYGCWPHFYSQNVSMFEFFMNNYPCSIVDRDYFGRGMLFYAQTPGMVDFLVERGVDLAQIDHYGRTALFHAQTPDVAVRLQELGLSHQDKDHYGGNVLFHSPNVDMLRYWMSMGIDIHHMDDHGRNAMFFAKTPGIVQSLMSHGLTYQDKDRFDRSVIFFAPNLKMFKFWETHRICKSAKGNQILLHHAQTLAIVKYIREQYGIRSSQKTKLYYLSCPVVGEYLAREFNLAQDSVLGAYGYASTPEAASWVERNFIYPDNWNPLINAQTPTMVQYFVSRGYDINTSYANEYPIEFARTSATGKAMIDMGADVTCLQGKAVGYRYQELTDIVIQPTVYSFNQNAIQINGKNDICLILEKMGPVRVLNILHQIVNDLDLESRIIDQKKYTLRHMSSREAHILAEKEKTLNKHRTIFFGYLGNFDWFCQYTSLEIVEFVQKYLDYSPHQVLQNLKNPEIAEHFMHKYEICHTQLGRFGKTVLHQPQSLDMVRYWAQRGLNLNQLDNGGATILDYQTDPVVIRYLAHHGVHSRNIPNSIINDVRQARKLRYEVDRTYWLYTRKRARRLKHIRPSDKALKEALKRCYKLPVHLQDIVGTFIAPNKIIT